MTYLKTLIALAGLVLITACAGGVTINTGNNDNTKTIDPCVTNPYGTDCAAPTARQRAVFCQDNTKITPTKTEDCTDIEDTVNLICSTNILDSLCPTASPTQAEAFCRDETKMTDTKTADCAPTVMRVCGDNIFDTFCAATPEQEADFCRIGTNANNFNGCKATIIEACNTNVFDTLCTTPTQQEAEAFCGDVSKSTDTKTADCAETVKTACTDDIYKTLCDDDPQYTNQRDAMRLQCIADGRAESVCNMEALVRSCTGNPFTPECVADYAPRRKTVCAGEINSPRCIPTVALVCDLDAFDTYCIGATAYRTEQLNQCADVTQTFETCSTFFTGLLLGCLEDPFVVGCDDGRAPVFSANKDSIQTKRFAYCQDPMRPDDDGLCLGYRVCNNSSGFLPDYCGVPFNFKRMEFCAIINNAFDVRCDNGLESQSAQMAHCMVTAQSFNPGCVGNLRDAAKQLEFCQNSLNPFGGGCAVAEFKAVRVAFCMQTPTHIGCRTDALMEDLMSEDDPCEGLGNTPACSVEITDLPDTYLATPATKVVQVPGDLGSTMDINVFDRGFLKTTAASFDAQGAVIAPTGTTLAAETFTIFGRRNLSDAATDANLDGYAYFRLFKEGLTDHSSDHVTILPTTNLGPALIRQPTAVWDGHFSYIRLGYANIPQKFHVDFSEGEFTFADITDPDNIVGGGAISVPDGSFGSTLTLNGLFADESHDIGQLGGNVTESSLGNDKILNLIGLIGAEGAVGVYLGEFSLGGFTASNPDHANYQRQTLKLDGRTNQATYDDWRDVTTPADAPNTTTRANQFLTTANHSLNNGTDGASAELADSLAINSATYNGGPLGGNNVNRINYYRFPVSTDNYFYAGISEFANVGVPFAAQPTGTWNGSFVAIDDTSTEAAPVDFNLTVTYGGAGAGYEGSVSSGTLGTTGYTFTGEFDSRGVIVGTTAHATNGAGVMQGLIGADVALGVFISNANASVGYGGGFVARHIPATN